VVIFLLPRRVLLVLQLSFLVIKMLGVLLVLLKSMYLQAHLLRELLRD
jgi:hypothetical protein